MKELLILSGKGGTGKTTVAGAFIKLLKAKAYADCDVDAPNLHLIAGQKVKPETKDFYGLPKAEIDQKICIRCGLCLKYCKFEAIEKKDGKYYVGEFSCEGCAVCKMICPVGAVKMNEAVAGELALYDGDAVFSTAKLKTGGGTSGKLVSEVKKRLNERAKNAEIAVIDGSPGIGCPVIASLSGADAALIVSEPSVSGISDMERILRTARHFNVPTMVCVNKSDANEAKTEEIKDYCQKNGLPFVGTIPYDANAVKAVNDGKSIAEIDCPSGRAVKKIFESVMENIS